jgi:hypothetical protein
MQFAMKTWADSTCLTQCERQTRGGMPGDFDAKWAHGGEPACYGIISPAFWQ